MFPHKRYVAEVWSNLDDGVYSVTVEARNLEEAHEKGSQKLREKHSEHGSDITVYEADANWRLEKEQHTNETDLNEEQARAEAHCLTEAKVMENQRYPLEI